MLRGCGPELVLSVLGTLQAQNQFTSVLKSRLSCFLLIQRVSLVILSAGAAELFPEGKVKEILLVFPYGLLQNCK